jgi:hypothetical protein
MMIIITLHILLVLWKTFNILKGLYIYCNTVVLLKFVVCRGDVRGKSCYFWRAILLLKLLQRKVIVDKAFHCCYVLHSCCEFYGEEVRTGNGCRNLNTCLGNYFLNDVEEFVRFLAFSRASGYEICALWRFYAAYNFSFLQVFRDNQSFPFS